ncbi:MAG: hypothetical protein WA125_03840, partial [Desulfosporosinus sp.]
KFDCPCFDRHRNSILPVYNGYSNPASPSSNKLSAGQGWPSVPGAMDGGKGPLAKDGRVSLEPWMAGRDRWP